MPAPLIPIIQALVAGRIAVAWELKSNFPGLK